MSSLPENDAYLAIDRDAVIVTAPTLVNDRSAKLFFNAILGAVPTEAGWRCPRRNRAISSLVVQINSFLERKGLPVHREGLADEAIQREIERKRSFTRAREAALALRGGTSAVSIDTVKEQLRGFGWNFASRNLFGHQEIGVIHGLTATNAANFSVPGAGKTVSALAIAATHVANGTIDMVLVVGPLSCFAPWEKEAFAALGKAFTPIRIRGSASKRRQTYLGLHSRNLVLMSYATASRDRAELIEVCRRLKVLLVVDESHRIKRFRGGLWAPALMEIAKFARVKLALSGTPMPQSGRDLYSQLRVLWPAGELTGPADDFATRVANNFPAILDDVHPFVSRTAKEALGLEPYTITRHNVDLTGTQEEIYALIENQFRRIIADADTWREKLDALRRGRPIRLLQAAANPDLLNKTDGSYHLPRFELPNPTLLQRLADYRHREIPAKSAKGLEILRDVVRRKETTGGKVVCWSNFVHNLDHFSQLTREQLHLPVFQIDGRVPTGDEPFDELASSIPIENDTRELIIERFLATTGPAVLVTNPASTSESVSLHSSCHNAIYLDRTYDCALYLQSIDRIHRLGLPKQQKVEIHLVLATRKDRQTIDHLVDGSLAAKEVTMRQLLEGAELAPLEEPDDPVYAAEGSNKDLSALLRYLLGEELSDAAEL